MPFSTARTRNGPNAVAPLWHTRPIGPVRPDAPREEEVAQMSCLTFASPRQLGPLIRMPEARANSPNSPQITPVVHAALGKARRDHDGRSRPLAVALLEDIEHLVVGHHDAHHVGCLRQVRDTR